MGLGDRFRLRLKSFRLTNGQTRSPSYGRLWTLAYGFIKHINGTATSLYIMDMADVTRGFIKGIPSDKESTYFDIFGKLQNKKLVVKTISATAGNVTKNLTVGGGKRWKLLYGKISLTTDATVANRYIALKLTDGSNITEEFQTVGAITASSTECASFQPDVSVQGTILKACLGHVALGEQILESGHQIRISISNGQAGDSYSGYMVVEETDMIGTLQYHIQRGNFPITHDYKIKFTGGTGAYADLTVIEAGV